MYKLIEFTGEHETVDPFLSFLSLPPIIYKDDKHYIPPSTVETVSWLKGTHKCAGFLKQKNLLVFRDGNPPGIPAARGIVFINTIGNFGSIGFFECMEDAEAVKILTDGAKEFCKEYEITDIYAPMNGSIWSNYRLMTKGFEDKPFPGEPYNKPYYSEILIKCGFKIAKTWESQFVKKVAAKGNAAERYLKEEKTQKSKGIKIRNMNNYDRDLHVVYKLAMNSFAQFFLFHEIDEADYMNIFSDMKLICDKRTIKIAYNSDNRPIGFGIALPDYRNKLDFFLRYAKRYIFLYLGTLQKDGESVYPQCGKAIVASILKSLYIRRKGYICAMMSEDSKTRNFSKDHKGVHKYALLKIEVN